MGVANSNTKVTYELQLIVFEKVYHVTGCGAPCKLLPSKLNYEPCLMSHFKSEVLMKRSNDILLPRALLSIQQVNLRPLLAMVYCEGLIEFRETATMNVISRDGNDQISSMAQIGLYFPGSRFGEL